MTIAVFISIIVHMDIAGIATIYYPFMYCTDLYQVHEWASVIPLAQ